MFESYLPGQFLQQPNVFSNQRQIPDEIRVREDSKADSKSSQLSLTRVISKDAKNRQNLIHLKVQDQNYKYNQNISESQVSRGSLPSQNTEGSGDSLNEQKHMDTDKQLFTAGISPTSKLHQNGLFNSNLAPTMEMRRGISNEDTITNSLHSSDISDMNNSMQGAEFQNPGIRRTATMLSEKKRIAGGSRDVIRGARLNEVHRDIHSGSQIYSEIVGVNHNWSRVSDSQLEENPDQLP